MNISPTQYIRSAGMPPVDKLEARGDCSLWFLRTTFGKSVYVSNINHNYVLEAESTPLLSRIVALFISIALLPLSVYLTIRGLKDYQNSLSRRSIVGILPFAENS